MELYHYGVKGMKWGVRRTPEQLGRCKSPKQSIKQDREILKNRQSLKRALQSLDPNDWDEVDDNVLGKHSRMYMDQQRKVQREYADARDKVVEKYDKLANKAGYDELFDLDPSWRSEHDMGPASTEGKKIWKDYCNDVNTISKKYKIDTGEIFYNNLLKSQLKDLKVSDLDYGLKRLTEMGVEYLDIWTEYNLD